MIGHYLCFLLFLWSFTKNSVVRTELTEGQKNKVEIVYPTMAPNSKFLNPHVDDATNLQFAIAAFGDEAKEPENSETTEELVELFENFGESTSVKEQQINSRASKSLKDWKLFPLLQSMINSKNKNYK